MPHAHHFLQRLDRLSRADADFALSLYRDESFLRGLLGGLRVSNTERVAIAVDDAESGPFVLVTMDGHFVTCLGAGMRPRDVPVVTRGQVEAARARDIEMGHRADVARAVARERGGRENLLQLPRRRADELTREELIAVSAWQPVLRHEFLGAFLRGTVEIEDAEGFLAHRDRAATRNAELLRRYWERLHANAHHLVLATMGETRELADFLVTDDWVDWTPSLPLVRERVLAVAARAAWAVGRLGKPLLATYKRQLWATSPVHVLDAVMGLTAIASRHRGFVAEVRKALRTSLTVAQDPQDAFARDAMLRSAELVFAAPVEASQRTIERGRQMAFRRAEALPADSVAELLVLNDDDDIVGIEDGYFACILAIASVARMGAPDLYLSREEILRFRSPWKPARVLAALERTRPHRKIAPVRARVAPRNALCACGSGKKHKRCCGR